MSLSKHHWLTAVGAMICAAFVAVLLMVPAVAATLKVQAETFSFSSPNITVTTPTSAEGDALRWLGGASTADRASVQMNFANPITELQLRTRNANGTEDMAIYVDGTKVATETGISAGFATTSEPVNISAGQHTVAFGPAAAFSSSDRLLLDYVSFVEGAGPTPTPTPTPTPSPTGKVGIGTGTANECNKVIQPGSQTLANGASSGAGTVCLRQGVYGGLGVINKLQGSGTSSKRLVVKSYPGERAEVRGQLNISGTYVTVRDMYFNGRYMAYSSGGGVTNGGNPDMTPTVLMGGNHVLFTNNEIDGGNGDSGAASGTRPMNERSTQVGYRDPSDDHFVRNWVHNAGVLAKYSKDGKADGHAIYFSNANGAGPHEFSDNVLWGVPDDSNAIDLHGMKVGPHGYDVMNNVVFDSSDTIDMNNQNADSHIAHNILIDPDGEPIRYDQGQGNNVIEDNCMNGDIKINSGANLTVRNNVIDRSASVTGTPKSSTWVINASSACLGKYQGTMYK